MQRMTGVVVSVYLSKGFAFVRGLDDGLSRFVYAKEVQPISAFDTMHEGQKVSFVPSGELDSSPDAKNNGLRGLQVRIENDSLHA